MLASASLRQRLRSRFVQLAHIGVQPEDADQVRAQKVVLTVASLTVVLLAFVWDAVYLALDLPVSAAIPMSYQVISIASLGILARTGNYRAFRGTQMVLMLALPFLLQWSLGGYAASSGVSLWAVIAVIGAVFFYSARAAIPWFGVFLGLSVVSGILDPIVARSAAPIPEPVVVAFFVLNTTAVAFTAFLLLQYAVRERDAAQTRSDDLLRNVLPGPIARRLMRAPGVIADRYDDVTVLFADLAGFTPFAEGLPPEELVGVLDEIFVTFDDLTQRAGLEKIKTIGDAYMVVGGAPASRPDHADAVAGLAADMHAAMAEIRARTGYPLEVRIGMASGPVVAGVIGRHRFLYDLWGDTVNTASRMESHGVIGRTQVTADTAARLSARFRCEPRGEIEVKGKGRIPAFLVSRTPDGTTAPIGSAVSDPGG